MLPTKTKRSLYFYKKQNLYELSYTTHTSYYFKSDIIKSVIYDIFNLFDTKFVSFETYYYNYLRAENIAKPVNLVRVSRYNSKPFVFSETKNKKFLNFDDNGLKSGIWNYITEIFTKNLNLNYEDFYDTYNVWL